MKFKEKYLLGLFLYLRMLQLSFDRAMPGKWGDLVEYLGRHPNCRYVISSLSITCKFEVVFKVRPNELVDLTQNYAKSTLRKLIQRKLALTKDEVSFIGWWLTQAAVLIERDESSLSADEIAEVRLNLAYAEELVRSRLKNKSQSILCVHHYNKNDMTSCQSIEEILGEVWPQI